jgi:hypothetical protein
MLSKGTRAIAVAFADTLFPADDDAPAGSQVIVDALEDLMAGMLDDERNQLVIGLNLLEMGALPVMRGRFSKLSPDKREKYLRDCASSRLELRRSLYGALRYLFANLYYSDERTWSHIHYAGPQVKREEVRP